MCDHAFAWAKQNKLWQINPIHKEEEASLVIERLFQVEENEGERMEQSGSFAVQDLGPKLNTTLLKRFNVPTFTLTC